MGLIKRFEEMEDNQNGCVDSPGIQPPMIGGKLLDSATVQRLNFTPAKESVPIELEVCREQPSGMCDNGYRDSISISISTFFNLQYQ